MTEYLYDRGPALVSAEGSWCMADGFSFTMRYTVNFEQATADFDISREHQLIVSTAASPSPSISPAMATKVSSPTSWTAVRTGRAPSRVTAADAVAGTAHPRSRAAQYRVGRNRALVATAANPLARCSVKA